ncbi:MAG TPA: type II secretion system F family protein [Mycobacteriales bacterium]|nr:type II secretion system F family protein [Mycobacteriales bacterium]
MTGWLAAGALAAAVLVAGASPARARVAAARQREFAGRGVVTLVVVGIGGGAVAVAGTAVVPLVVGGLVAVAVVERIRRTRRAARDRDLRAAAAVELTFALAGELRAGRTPSQALAAAAPTAGPLRAAVEAAGLAASVGASPGQALLRAAREPGASRLRYVAAAWTVTETVGGRIAVVLERLSEAMDDDEELRRELTSAMAGPNATMVMLAALPVLGVALGQAVGADPVRLLLHRPIGWILAAVAAVFDGVGIWATRAIARAAVRS